MQAIDEFSTSLLEEAKAFLEKAQEKEGSPEGLAYLHASLMIAFCSLEAHVNGIAGDFSERSDLSPLDVSILSEKDLRISEGEFKISGLKMYRLEDRILFLHKRFSGKPLNRKASFWSELSAAAHQSPHFR